MAISSVAPNQAATNSVGSNSATASSATANAADVSPADRVHAQTKTRAQRILILSATARDGQLALEVLAASHIAAEVCGSVGALAQALDEGVGGLLVVEEALVEDVVGLLTRHVAAQPEWSDLPILVLTGEGPARTATLTSHLGNLIVLERPVRTATLISSVRSALRARERQYQVRDAQTRLRENEQRFKSMFDYHPDGAFVRDLAGNFISVNEAHEALLGYSLDELQDLSGQHFLLPNESEEVQAHFSKAAAGHPQKFSTVGTRKDGTEIEVEAVYLPVVVDGKVVGVQGIARDVTQANDYERRIKYLATHDALTGLPNRELLNDRLEHAIEQAKRAGGQAGVLFLDLNRFKQVNDSLGHEKGDKLLKIIAARLQGVIRDADTVARLGGDEFVMVLEKIQSLDDMVAVAQNVIEIVERPVELDGHHVSVSTSIGGSLYPKDATDVNNLLKAADTAMYQAKELGSGAFRFYNPQMNQHVLERLLTENALRQALQNQELEVHYQPRVNVRTKQIVGVEALVRWNHPEKGLILPADFIPLAEEIGLINEIGEWVLRTACQQGRLWQEQGLQGMRMAVNVSAHQLAAPMIGDKIKSILAGTQFDAGCLELEITESSLMKNLSATSDTLANLREHGVTIAMDDFGTGYSSLTQIKHLPVDTLKIDKSFVRNMASDPNDIAIVSATIALAHHMGLHIVAEGVTSKVQLGLLAERDCHEMQGYLFGRPQPAAEVVQVLGNVERLHSHMVA